MKKSIVTFSFSLEQLPGIARQFWDLAHPYHIILFSGEMGMGKTTFISALCQCLGVEDDVSSPTFSLINEYQFSDSANQIKSIFHIDLYRINSVPEAINAGIEDTILNAVKDGNYIFLEWPEKALELIPEPYLLVKLDALSEAKRKMQVVLVDRL